MRRVAHFFMAFIVTSGSAHASTILYKEICVAPTIAVGDCYVELDAGEPWAAIALTCRLTQGIPGYTVDIVSHSNYSFDYPITSTPEIHDFQVVKSPADMGAQYCVRFENVILKHHSNPQQNLMIPAQSKCAQLSNPPRIP